MYACVYVCIYVCIHMYICMYEGIFILNVCNIGGGAQVINPDGLCQQAGPYYTITSLSYPTALEAYEE
jgi:hypothetical protein